LPYIDLQHGSACGPVIVPVFKTGDRYLAIAMMGSTPIRFRQLKGSLDFARDFACGLTLRSRPQNGSTSKPAIVISR
jgi:hypothetical protein